MEAHVEDKRFRVFIKERIDEHLSSFDKWLIFSYGNLWFVRSYIARKYQIKEVAPMGRNSLKGIEIKGIQYWMN